MTSITTRAGKGTPLTHTEVDDNFTNLNADKLEASNNLSDVSSASAARTNLGLGTGDSPTFAGLATTGNVSFGDNDKAIFGAGSDLQIFHSGTASWIRDLGTGGLVIDTDGTTIDIKGSSPTEYMARFIKDGAVSLYYDNAAKLATTSTGIDVTGQLAADSGQFDGNVNIDGAVTADGLTLDGKIAAGDELGNANLSNTLDYASSAGVAGYRPINLIDSSAGVKISRPNDDGNGAFIEFQEWDSTITTLISRAMLAGEGGDLLYRNLTTGGGDHIFQGEANAELMRIDSSGNVGIGTGSPSAKLEVREGDTDAVSVKTDGHIQLYDPSNSTRSYTFLSRQATNSMVGGNIRLDSSVTTGSHIGYSNGTDLRGGSGIVFENTAQGAASYGDITFVQSNDTNDDTWVVREAMRIDSSGRVGIGTSSPSATLDVNGSLSKNSGSFKIDHPLKPDTHHLVHSFVEGPQADNLYRGKVTLVGGRATVNLDEAGRMTEGTFVALNGNVQCFTTNENGWTQVRGSVNGNTLKIESQDDTCTDEVSWLVIGERHDQHMIDTEWTDENGRVITEPLKG